MFLTYVNRRYYLNRRNQQSLLSFSGFNLWTGFFPNESPAFVSKKAFDRRLVFLTPQKAKYYTERYDRSWFAAVYSSVCGPTHEQRNIFHIFPLSDRLVEQRKLAYIYWLTGAFGFSGAHIFWHAVYSFNTRASVKQEGEVNFPCVAMRLRARWSWPLWRHSWAGPWSFNGR